MLQNRMPPHLLQTGLLVSLALALTIFLLILTTNSAIGQDHGVVPGTPAITDSQSAKSTSDHGYNTGADPQTLPIWSATLTADYSSGIYGFSSVKGSGFGSLSPTSFVLEGITYTVPELFWNGKLHFGVDRSLPAGFTLYVGGLQFDAADASFQTYSDVPYYIWQAVETSPFELGQEQDITLNLHDGSPNIPATGLPTIRGTVQVGQTLTADTSRIADADGLTSAAFSYKWTKDGSTARQSITSPTYTLVDADEGKTIKVRVSFTDDAGHAELLTSEPTAVVTPKPNSPATGLPIINGTPQVGETLTVDASSITDADGMTGGFNYQWTANDGSDDTDIAGATGAAYTLVVDDAGKTVKVRVSFTDDAGHAESLTSEPTAVVTPKPNSPATGLPIINGTPQVGETLTVDASSITDADGMTGGFNYQWTANDGSDDTDIAGATGAAYTLVDDDAGKTVKVRVSFTDDAGYAESLTSEPTAVVTPKPNSPATGLPTINGTPQVGETLTVDASSITDADGITGGFNYQWTANDGVNDADIAGATGAAYTLVDDDAGKTVKVRVSFTDDAGYAESLTSEPTAVVAPKPNSPATGPPTISGAAQVGKTLTVDTSSITDADGITGGFNYQWTANDGMNDADIAGATGAAYTLVDDDEGKTIKVRVSFTDDAGHAESLTSEQTAVVSGSAPTFPPEALQVTTGASRELVVSWEAPSAGPLPTAYKVQWKSGTEDFDGSATSTRQARLTDISTLTYTIAGLMNGIEYTVRVIGYNATGDGPPSPEETATPEAPNIIVIFADDLGYKDVSFNGAEEITTTNLDRLAAEGITFTNGYVTAPVCSPSRSGLLTGRYPARFGMEANIAYNPFDKSLGLPTDEKLLPFYLDNAGYYTGVVGKWHLGAAQKFTPLERGFDYFYGFLGGGHDYWKVDASDPGNKFFLALAENRNPTSFTGYLTDALTDKAIEFVNEDRDQPFFLFLPYNAPHDPFQAPRELKEKYGHISDYERRVYLAMVDSLDQNVGRLLETLEQSGKRDNTIIFFLSDNGGDAIRGPMDNGELRGGKRSLYEGGIRVPFVASWPARWPQGETYDPVVISLDIAATVLGQAKATVTDPSRPIDGVNLDPYLRGEQEGRPHEAVFWRETRSAKVSVVRAGDMKLIQVNEETPMLYNLADDIGEEHDLFATDRETAVRLANLWNQWNRNNLKGNLVWDRDEYVRTFKRWLMEYADERSNWVQGLPVQQIVIN